MREQAGWAAHADGCEQGCNAYRADASYCAQAAQEAVVFGRLGEIQRLLQKREVFCVEEALDAVMLSTIESTDTSHMFCVAALRDKVLPVTAVHK